MSVAAQMSEKISGTPPKVIVAFHSGQCEWGVRRFKPPLLKIRHIDFHKTLGNS